MHNTATQVQEADLYDQGKRDSIAAKDAELDKAKAEIAELKAKLAGMQIEQDQMRESNDQLKGKVLCLQSNVEKAS